MTTEEPDSPWGERLSELLRSTDPIVPVPAALERRDQRFLERLQTLRTDPDEAARIDALAEAVLPIESPHEESTREAARRPTATTSPNPGFEAKLAGRTAPRIEPNAPMPVKMVIAGGFGVGKTTAIASVSDTSPLTTEATITEASATVDDLSMTPGKTTTTTAIDFGSVMLDPTLKLYLFGTPGQDRFGFMWDDIVDGALGALVVVDSRRLGDSFPALDYFERRGIPFAVAVNRFAGAPAHPLEAVREALDVEPEVPVIEFDARDHHSVLNSLITVLEIAMAREMASGMIG